MAQTQVFRGVASHTVQKVHRVSGYYHGTEVACVERVSNGMARVTLNTGGYFTNTTKTRMNQFAAQFCQHQYGVYQKKGEWFVAISRIHQPIPFNGNVMVFLIEADKVDFAKGE
jgi:hypothetical protein